jgi:tripeptidyl-peptidase I
VPVFASIITNINDTRFCAGNKTVGFTNPVLYAHRNTMKDTTIAANYGCGREGFHASKGWDLVTGLGTPHFERMKLYSEFP